MLTTAGAARSTASAYELTAGDAVSATGAVTTGTDTGAACGSCAKTGAGRGIGVRRATSSGRTMTAMNAAARPTTADKVTKVTIRRTGRIDISSLGAAFS